MVDEFVAAPAAKSSARGRIAVLLLVLILGFIGYGIFERLRLMAAVENERKAVQTLRSLQGMPIESAMQDWRVIFVPDRPEIAMRVGGVYVSKEGAPPEYTKQIAGILRVFELCKEMNISAGPVSGGLRMGPAPKRVLKPGEIPPEMLDLSVIRTEFPHLKVNGEEYLIRTEDAAVESAPGETKQDPTNGKTGVQKPVDDSDKDDVKKEVEKENP
jgi:hypothetical protein